tara:strand:- start:135 stop:317 length:183 start_codon:yes stop_codon:yes gene_type:complete
MNKLNEKDMRLLKENGLVADVDVVYMMGDTIVAENIQTGAKRIIEAPHLMLECKRRVLRG